MIQAPWNLLSVPRELASEFLGVFARFEYALKAAGFATGGATRLKADWTTFGASASPTFNRHASKELDSAAGYLDKHPPQVQALAEAAPSWVPAAFAAGSTELQRLLSCVQIVRNNLFHGGKFFPNQNDPARDIRLVEACLLVLDAALTLDANVERAFHE